CRRMRGKENARYVALDHFLDDDRDLDVLDAQARLLAVAHRALAMSAGQDFDDRLGDFRQASLKEERIHLAGEGMLLAVLVGDRGAHRELTLAITLAELSPEAPVDLAQKLDRWLAIVLRRRLRAAACDRAGRHD